MTQYKPQTRKGQPIANTYEYNGADHTITELSHLSGIATSTLNTRIVRNGWTITEAMETPVGQPKETHELSKEITEIGERMTQRMLELFYGNEKDFDKLVKQMRDENPRTFFKDVLMPAVKEFGNKHTGKSSVPNVLINLPGFGGNIDSDGN